MPRATAYIFEKSTSQNLHMTSGILFNANEKI